MNEISSRLAFTKALARRAGAVALAAFREIDTLEIEKKGHQDLVSNADRETELLIRRAIEITYPDDGIVGEEHADKPGTTGHTWVIDPIDGTANFVTGIPAWCVIIACVDQAGIEVGVICEPSSGETFWASRGQGAFVNDKPMEVSKSTSLQEGSVGTGYAARENSTKVMALIGELIGQGGMFFRNASGGLMLAYTAAGRLIGYLEEDMNSWDCLAGILMISEAGGKVKMPPVENLANARIPLIAGGPGVYDALEDLANRHFPG